MPEHPTLDTLRRLAEDARLVSVDVFDTAILRMLSHPRDVFALVERRLSRQTGHPVAFAAPRIQAERRARRERVHAGREDVTLDDIYDFLLLPGFSPSEIEATKALEIETEQELSLPNPQLGDFIREYISHGGKLVFTSDMYLPRHAITGMLDKAGYTGYRALYLSSEEGVSKAGGGLYRVVSEREGVAPADILHLGDNPYSDVRKARAAGLTAHLTPPPRRAVPGLLYHPRLRGDRLARSAHEALLNVFPPGENPWYRLGFERLGVMLLGFTCWLADCLRRDAIDRVYFCARDGHLLKLAYDLLRCEDPDLPESRYLYVSRRALMVPAITELGEREMTYLTQGEDSCSVAHFFRRLGLDPDAFSDDIRRVGFTSGGDLVDSPRARDRLRDLMRAVEAPLLKLALAERGPACRYLIQEGLADGSHTALVDLGWAGSIPHALRTLLERDCGSSVRKAYYLATVPAARRTLSPDEASAYLLDYGLPSHRMNVMAQGLAVFELLHMAPHGSVLGYTEEGGRLRPVLDSVTGKTDDAREDLHRGVTDYLSAWLSLPGTLWRELIPDPDGALSPLARVIDLPTHEEVRTLGAWHHSPATGSGGPSLRLAPPEGSPSVLALPRTIRGYRRSYWKGAYLAQLPPLSAGLIRALLALRDALRPDPR